MVKYIDGRDSLVSDHESDYEGESTGVGNQLQKPGEKEQTRAVLIRGTFSACVRLP